MISALYHTAYREGCRELVWLPHREVGFYPVRSHPYDAEYFRRYRVMEKTAMGRELIKARWALVDRHAPADLPVLDVGIGAGGFLEAGRDRGRKVSGYDVNPAAVAWLEKRGRFVSPYNSPVPVATFWDSLEHVLSPARLLAQVREWAFISLPIFTGPEHILRSKHFRPTEHRWYWTHHGFLAFMGEEGWELAEHNTWESVLGREDIETFAFRRIL